MSKDFKNVLIYIFSVVLAGILLALGLDVVNQKINKAILVDSSQNVSINDIK